jgi:large subunit ribosomal protein L9
VKVFLKKDVEKVGFANQIVSVNEGFARNFLFPQNLAVEVTRENEKLLSSKVRVIEHKKEAVATATSMLAEKIKHLSLTLRKKAHKNGELYGSVNATDVADLLATQGISVGKNQIEMEKIKREGSYSVTVRLSNRLQSAFTLTVTALS